MDGVTFIDLIDPAFFHFPRATSLNDLTVSTSVSASRSDTTLGNPKRGTSRRNRMPVWMVVLITLTISAVVFLIMWTQGHVKGQEFSPTHFQTRDFHFYEIPLLHVQLTPIRRSSATPATATYVRQKSLIGPVPTGAPTTWHLVNLSRGASVSQPADAELLIDQFLLTKDGKPYWKTWSADHPEFAKRFWPVIRRLAERELYILMPRLFEIAQESASPKAMSTEIDRELRQNYASLIRDMRDAGRDDLAEQFRVEAIADYPDDSTLRSPPAPPTKS